MAESTCLESALRYAAQGWPVLPLHTADKNGCSCRRVDCGNQGKHPRTKHGVKDATADRAAIEGWWKKWPDANVGIATGVANGFWVLDQDGEAGEATIAAWNREHGDLPRTPTTRTGGGGLHRLFKHVPGLKNAVRFAPGLDIRTDGGFIVAPPSLHVSGCQYEWVIPPATSPIAEAPSWLLDLIPRKFPSCDVSSRPIGNATRILNRSSYARKALEGEVDRVLASTPNENRNSNLNAAAFNLGQLVRTGALDEIEVIEALLGASRSVGLSDSESIATIRSGMSAGQEHPRKPKQMLHNQAPRSELCTDLGNAHRLVLEHGVDLKNTNARGWFVWDGRRWAPDETGAAMRRVKATVRNIWNEARDAPTPDEAEILGKWALKSQMVNRLQAVLTVAASEPEISMHQSEFDRDPFLLNCLNGTVDLRSGELRPHRREDLITKIVRVPYDPAAAAPTWKGFLDRIMAGNVDLIGYLQRAVGYSLTGDVREQVWFFFYGTGANGKSTFLVIILDVLGEYGRQAAPDLLLAKRGEAHPTELADLAGCRLAVCTEIEHGRSLAEVRSKQLTGGDRIKARFMRQDFFEFDPTHKIFVAANHKPHIRGTDHAVWRRIHLIPFNVTIPDKEQDRKLVEKLRAELPGILAWAVRGCLAWQAHGLNPPEEVVAATDKYREEEDPLGEFLAEECVIQKHGAAPAEDLFNSYRGWCQKNNEQAVSQKDFGGLLTERGLTRKKHGPRRRWWWFGIGLVNPSNPSDPDLGMTLCTRAREASSENEGSDGFMGSPQPVGGAPGEHPDD